MTAQENRQMNVNEETTLENTWSRPFLGSIMNEVQTKVLCETELRAFMRQNISVYLQRERTRELRDPRVMATLKLHSFHAE